jgi:hypothetical protein
MRTILAVAVVAGLAWVAAPAGADAPRSLGDVAAKEKEKKKGKVFTEDDLRNPGRRAGTVSQPSGGGTPTTSATASPTPAGSPGTGAAAGAAAEKPKTEEEERADREKDWRERLTKAQADVATWTSEVSRLQALVNDNSGVLYGPGRAARVDALENAKRQLTAANQAVESLQEEGRRNRFR